MTGVKLFTALIIGADLPHVQKEMEILAGVANVVLADINDRSKLGPLLKTAHALLTDDGIIDRWIIDQSPELQVIGKYGAGVDNIDVGYATEKGIVVCNAPDVLTSEVAQHTLALILCQLRRILIADRDIRLRGLWDHRLYDPIGLKNKTVGIIGFGRIGREVARIIKSLCQSILVYDPHVASTDIESSGYVVVSLDDLLRKSDIVTIHVPLTIQTRHMIGRAKLDLMKKNAVLINVSRGAIIDEAALLEKLLNKGIAGAALDVLEVEPPPRNHPLFALEQVLITPHIGWKSEVAALNAEVTVACDVRKVLLGQIPE